jgi:hypothetical protein
MQTQRQGNLFQVIEPNVPPVDLPEEVREQTRVLVSRLLEKAARRRARKGGPSDE